MKAKIKFNCALPLVVSGADAVYEVWVDFGESTQAWHVVAARLGQRSKCSITVGNPIRDELERALSVGVELLPDPAARVMVSEMVNQHRAELVAAA